MQRIHEDVKFGPTPERVPPSAVLGMHWVACAVLLVIVRPPFALDDHGLPHAARIAVIASTATAAALALKMCGLTPATALCSAVETLHRVT